MMLRPDNRGPGLLLLYPPIIWGIDYITNIFNSNLGSFFASKMQFEVYRIANLISLGEIKILIIESP